MIREDHANHDAVQWGRHFYLDSGMEWTLQLKARAMRSTSPHLPRCHPPSIPSKQWRPRCPCQGRKSGSTVPTREDTGALCQLGGVDHPSHTADEGSIGTQHLQTETKTPIWSAEDGLAALCSFRGSCQSCQVSPLLGPGCN